MCLSVLLACPWAATAATPSVAEAAEPVPGVAKIEAGDGFALALAEDGSVWAWGSNEGTFGNGSYYDSYYPTKIRTLPAIADIAAGPDYALAIEAGGYAMWAWGDNSSGQLGIGTTGGERPFPVKVDLTSIGPAKEVEAGEYYSLLLTEDGDVYAWGANASGELGTGHTGGWSVPSPAPVRMADTTPLANVKDIEAGNDFFLALTNDGKVYAWGLNYSGQIGIGSSSTYYVTTPTEILNGATGVFSNWEAYHAFATVGDAVYGWGNNNVNQLGLNSGYHDVTVPTPIPSLTSAKHISMGELHSIAVDGAGSVWGTGENNDGVLLTKQDTTAFELLLSGEDAVSVATTDESVYMLREDGAVAVWGLNDLGQLGLGWVEEEPIVEKHFMPTLTQRGFNVTYRFMTPPASDGDQLTLGCGVATVRSAVYGNLQGLSNDDGSCTYYDLQSGTHELRSADGYEVLDAIPALTGDAPAKDIVLTPGWLPEKISFTDFDYRRGYIRGYPSISVNTSGGDITPSYRLFFVDENGVRVSSAPILTTSGTYSEELPVTPVPAGAKGLRYYVDNAATETVEAVPMIGWLPLLDTPYQEPSAAFVDDDKDDGIAGKLIMNDAAGADVNIKQYSVYYYASGERVDVATFAAGFGTKELPLPGVTANRMVSIDYKDAHGNVARTREVYAYDDISARALPSAYSDLPNVPFTFNDKDSDAGQLGGALYVSTYNSGGKPFSGYRAYFLNEAGDRLQGIVQVPSTQSYQTIYLPENLAIPEGAKQIGVFAYNADGLEGAAANALFIWDVPVFYPVDAQYADTNEAAGAVNGKLTWKRAADESAIDAYVIVGYDASYNRSTIAEVPATGQPQYEYALTAASELTVLAYTISVKKDNAQINTDAYLDAYDDTKASPLDRPTNPALSPPSKYAFAAGSIENGAFSGHIAWEGNSGDYGYQLYYATSAGEKLESIGFFKKGLYKSVFGFTAYGRAVPEGTAKIAIYTVDSDLRESPTALLLSIGSDTPPPPPPPDAKPTQLSFIDINPAAGHIGGTIYWHKGQDDSQVTEYRIYLMDAQGVRLGEALGSVPKSPNAAYRFDVPLDRSAASGATDVVVAAMAGGTELGYAHIAFIDAASVDAVLAQVKPIVKPSGAVALIDLISYARRTDRMNLAGDASFGKEDFVMLLQLIDPAFVEPPILH